MSIGSELPQVAVSGRNPLTAKPREGGPADKSGRKGLAIFLAAISLVWLFPIAWAILNSFRDYAFTAKNGYVSWGGFTLDNYANAWERANFGHTLINLSLIHISELTRPY